MQEFQSAGIHVAEEGWAGEAITRTPTAVTAFVGRALRGPLNVPVSVTSFSDYQRTFGGLWQPSPLSYAVEQYFEHGGREAVIVRVANGARAATLTLPAGRADLCLEALCPGTREFLRAAVDYDGIGPAEPDLFNLVLQRVRAPGAEFIEDQEIYRRASVSEASPRSLAALLADSRLVRLAGPLPVERPEPTVRADARMLAAYVHSNPDGDDGAPLTDYDLIGSATARTGLFALADTPFNFLVLPPLTREQPAGAVPGLVAARFCRERRALLLVDPPPAWETPADALAGMRSWGLATQDAAMWFPWLEAHDRLRGRTERFAPSAAMAGLLARADEQHSPWVAGEAALPVLRPGYRLACTVSDADRARLAAQGLNVPAMVRSPGDLLPTPRTLAGDLGPVAAWRSLAERRRSLAITESILRGTRWTVFAPGGITVWRRLAHQVGLFLGGLEAEGAFLSPANGPATPTAPGTHWFVLCDERLNPPDQPPGHLHFLFGYAAHRAGEWQSFLVSQAPMGPSVRTATLNRLQSAGGLPPLDPELDVATLFTDRFRR